MADGRRSWRRRRWPTFGLGRPGTGLGSNGGAYIEFEGTHHLPGDQVTGEVYVSIPQDERDLLDRGPFYAYLLPGNAFIEEGRPIPPGAIRVGTFAPPRSRAPDGMQTELRVAFNGARRARATTTRWVCATTPARSPVSARP